MIEPLISLGILNNERVFRPGDLLECEFQIDAVEPGEVQAVEASVLWYTEGKGDEDMGVHFFERRVAGDSEELDLRQLHRFSTKLPNSPQSYAGLIVKIHWCVRVRAFFRGGKELFFDQPFQLGDVPPALLPDDGETESPPE